MFLCFCFRRDLLHLGGFFVCAISNYISVKFNVASWS
nr:MAG TPA: hypothetical protein [Herelleviridae sp.]